MLSDCQSLVLVDGTGDLTWVRPGDDLLDRSAASRPKQTGHWTLHPHGPSESTRTYVEGTLVLETTFQTESGLAVLTDALLVGVGERGHALGTASPHVLVRRFHVLEGETVLEGAFSCLGTADGHPPLRWSTQQDSLMAGAAQDDLELHGCPPATIADRAEQARGVSSAEWTQALKAGQSRTFALLLAPAPGEVWPEARIVSRLEDTVLGWQSWSALHHAYRGRWPDQVALAGRVLKGLSSATSGALLAPPDRAPGVPPRRRGRGSGPQHRDAPSVAAAQRIAACAYEAARTAAWHGVQAVQVTASPLHATGRGAIYTALLGWVALDRAASRSRPRVAGAGEAQLQAAAAGRALLRRASDPSTGAYTGGSGSTLVEASALLLLLSGLTDTRDAVMSQTVSMVSEVLSAPCGLLYRDELAIGQEGASLPCTYWLVECLAAQGQAGRAEAVFEQATAYANDVGLLSEQVDLRTGQLLGGLPAAGSHAGLALAAAALRRGRVENVRRDL